MSVERDNECRERQRVFMSVESDNERKSELKRGFRK